jgi:hypothetical protein
VAAIRVGLSLLPFRTLRAILARVTSRPRGRGADEETVTRIAWAVAAAGARVPGASCLSQALAAQVLLARLGELSDLRIGVARRGAPGLTAHAWLEHRGRVIVGGATRDQFTPLPFLDERRAGPPAVVALARHRREP